MMCSLSSNHFTRAFLLCLLIAVALGFVALVVVNAIARPGLAIGIALGFLLVGGSNAREWSKKSRRIMRID